MPAERLPHCTFSYLADSDRKMNQGRQSTTLPKDMKALISGLAGVGYVRLRGWVSRAGWRQ